jgi:DnaB-like helicase N terminal domain/Protein of unknown function (DUF3987)
VSTNGNGYHDPFGPGVAIAAPVGDMLPPQHLEAERAVLGAVLMEPGLFDQVLEVLDVGDFYREAHQVVYRGMVDLRREDLPLDAIHLADLLSRRNQYRQIGGDELLREIAGSTPHAENCLYHARIVREKSTMRRAMQVSQDVIRDGLSQTQTAGEVLDRAISRLTSLFGDGEEDEQAEIRGFPEPPGEAAYHGTMGRIIRLIEPHTEASPIAILIQLLVGFGNIVRRAPHWVHESNRHSLNLFVCIVGTTASGRKGTSWGHARRILTAVDSDWARERIMPGINSGPALIEQVADEAETRQGAFLRGVLDKRILMYESEFARLLALFARDSETLGMVLRQAWEEGELAALAKKNPVRATGAHVSVVAHATVDDLNARLTLTDIANGLGNRFMWVASRKSKDLRSESWPGMDRLGPLIDDLRDARDGVAKLIGPDPTPMGRSREAQRFWFDQLAELRKPRPGLLGALLARGPAQVMRLAAIYALIDKTATIRVEHLEAALEIWAYCVRSIEFIFGDRLGDPDADALLQAIDEAAPKPLTQTRIRREVFKGHMNDGELQGLLSRMVRSGFIRRETVPTSKLGGRPATGWVRDTPPSPPDAPDAPKPPPSESKPF